MNDELYEAAIAIAANLKAIERSMEENGNTTPEAFRMAAASLAAVADVFDRMAANIEQGNG